MDQKGRSHHLSFFKENKDDVSYKKVKIGYVYKSV